MRLKVSREAQAEIDEAAAYLDSCQRGLAADLIAEYEAAITDVLQYPEANRIIGPRGTRRKRLPHMRYGIVYRVINDTVVVIAFMHLHRRPGYWRDRL